MDDHDEIGALRQEVRRLTSRVRALEEENADLLRRFAFIRRELEDTRAKNPKGISAS